MLYFRDLVLYESEDTLTLSDNTKKAIEDALAKWAKQNAKDAHKDDLLYVIFDKGLKDKQQLPVEDVQNAQMKIKNSLATFDIEITDELRNQIPKNGDTLIFTCVIVKPNKDKEAEILEIGKGTIIIPQGFEIVYKMENSVLLNGNVGSLIQIEYNIDEQNINVKVKENKGNKTDKPTTNKPDIVVTPVVNVPETVSADLGAAAHAEASITHEDPTIPNVEQAQY